MTAVIVVLLILLGIGIVAAPLYRLREWLQKSLPAPKVQEPPDDDT